MCLEADNKDCILLLKEHPNSNNANPNGQVYLVLDEDVKRSAPFHHNIDKKIFHISKDTYSKLYENIGEEVHIKIDSKEKIITQNHVVSMITGQSHDVAVVISAHYDHVGKINNTIWRGAIDNASGVSAMLQIAEELSTYYKTTKPPVDIIFCAFNSEESSNENYSMGSSYFSEYLKTRYNNIYNINFDCVGGNVEDNLITFDINSKSNTNEIKNILEVLQESFIANNYDTAITENSFASDHWKFDEGINISTGTGDGLIHTPKDTKELLNPNYIYQISEIVYEYIINSINIFIKTNDETNYDDSKIFSIIDSEEEKLQPYTLKYMEIEDNVYCIINNEVDTTIEDIKNISKVDLSSISKYLDVEDVSGTISYYYDWYDPNKHELDKIYDVNTEFNNFVTIRLFDNSFGDQINNSYTIEIVNIKDKNSAVGSSLYNIYLNQDYIYELEKDGITYKIQDTVVSYDEEGNPKEKQILIYAEKSFNEKVVFMTFQCPDLFKRNGFVHKDIETSLDELNKILEQEKFYEFANETIENIWEQVK
ncbi:M28 family peptidase [Sedimentibacter sp. zth1]|uniref:M28 family metallopeptidase n=1 Tax=Sedimentibacter sp. zth1 TaxID=2816908 RepID=UPI001A93A70F|nr:M28 family peptidase [Sedimentibacter sp. zth1]QSX05736.1 M28 family peptidase [Sedimentibacter sp. zth1]